MKHTVKLGYNEPQGTRIISSLLPGLVITGEKGFTDKVAAA
jgi:hypothetical protein